ncbi:MAG TPA: hypothetical protein VM144_15720 [Aestuariivirga sp.]|nr:hypothetical protein [Aestuariivirga sp.]
MTRIGAAAAREIEELHAVFVELFCGRSHDLSRCAAAFSAHFEMVTPDGKNHDRADVLLAIERAKASSDFSIAISNIRSLWEHKNSVLIQYVEQQYRDGKTSRRLSTALFEAEAKAPCGVVWRHLHETWMQNAE